MIDRNSQFMAILTNVGAAKLANANALGIPWNLTELGVGDANGADPMPSPAQTKLINEQRRAPLNQLRVDPVNAAVIIAEQVIPADVGGWWIREIGLYDSDGDLVAVSNCAPSFKPALDQGSGRTQIVRMNFIVSSINNIVLKIDPAIVLATREYVDLAITEAINKQDFKHSVLVATTANIALNGIQTIDGVLLTADARVLVKDQAQAKDNGIYVVPANGAWKRAQDADAGIEVTPGLFVSVEKGTANGDSVWQLVTDAPIILGTTALTFEVVAGLTGIVAGTYRSLTVDKNGRVIAGTNPTTLAGAGITDAVSSNNDNAVVGKISDVNRAQFINGNPVAATTDLPPGVSYFSGFRAKYNGGKLGFDFGCSMTDRKSFGRLTLADGTGGWFEYWTSANFDPSQKANLASPSFSGTPTAPTAAAGSNSSQLANTAFVWSAVNTYATTVNASLAAKADKATSLLVGSPSQQRPELAAPAGGDDWPASALIIREAGLVANTQTANFYAPGIAFHWGAVIAKKLFMDAVGVLRWGGKALFTTDSVAAPAEVDAGVSGSVLVTPWTLLLGFNFVRGTNGAIVFPNWLGRFIIQWGVTSSIGNGAAAAFNYPIAFPNAAVCPGAFRRGTGNNSATVETNLTQITITNRAHYSNDSSATANVYFFFCIGY
jgi:hypothetical protein